MGANPDRPIDKRYQAMTAPSDYQLRLINENDRARVLAWRNQDRVRANMYTDHIISGDEHSAWLSNALTDSTSRYLIAEYSGRPIGLVSFNNIDKQHGRCSWAFYLGETDAPRGSGAAMEMNALDYAFQRLKIRKLCCEVFAFNTAVLRLHSRFGFAEEGRFIRHVHRNGEFQDVVYLARFGETWLEDRVTILEGTLLGGRK